MKGQFRNAGSEQKVLHRQTRIGKPEMTRGADAPLFDSYKSQLTLEGFIAEQLLGGFID